MATSEMRHRKKSAKKQSDRLALATKSKRGQESSKATTKEPNVEEETLWETFHSHPLVVVASIVLIPCATYWCFFFFTLRRPDLLRIATAGIVSPRPAVHLTDKRQLLIVGSLGSGTPQVVAALSDLLQLEVTHDSVNAQSYFCRDGTVSNFLGLRYVAPPKDSRLETALTHICLNGSPGTFHPRYYRPSNCSLRMKWSDCWAEDCLKLVSEEWGCALGGYSACRPLFATVLHQVQHPVLTIQELMAKVCPRENMTPHLAFRQLAAPFVSARDLCLQEVSWYVVNFNEAMLKARDAGLVQATFQYENTTMCEIIEVAGFPQKLCSHRKANIPLPQLEAPRDDQQGLSRLRSFTKDDYQDAALVKALHDLCKRLGYDPETLS
jgi:hypothetical protein